MRNKKGFTLAEILIALGIISVMAALMATSFSHVKPNKTKMMYLKAYDSLLTAVSHMANNDTLFKPIVTNEVNGRTYTYNIMNAPLLDPQQPTGYSTNVKDDYKFARLLETAFKGTDGAAANNTYSFRSGPGNYTWTIRPIGNILNITSSFTQNVSFCNQVTLTIDDADTFNFCVQPNGMVQTLDDRGQTFINNRRNPRSVNDTAATASQYVCTANAITVTPVVNNNTVTPTPTPTPTPTSIPMSGTNGRNGQQHQQSAD